ncbi:hypothetical protein ES703_00503 [subsurface metagenome]
MAAEETGDLGRSDDENQSNSGNLYPGHVADMCIRLRGSWSASRNTYPNAYPYTYADAYTYANANTYANAETNAVRA